MDDLEKIRSLIAKSKTIKVGGLEFNNVKPLNFQELAEVAEIQKSEGDIKATAHMLKVTLKNSVEGITDKDIDAIDVNHVKVILDEINRINGVKTESKKKEGLEESLPSKKE